MGTMTLRKALDQFDGQILTDGAQDWDQDNLLEALEAIEQNEDPEEAQELGYVLLDDQVYVDEAGIRKIKADGYLGDYIYTVKEVLWCESCLQAGENTPATTHSKNPDWSGYELCGECAAEYDKRPPLE